MLKLRGIRADWQCWAAYKRTANNKVLGIMQLNLKTKSSRWFAFPLESFIYFYFAYKIKCFRYNGYQIVLSLRIIRLHWFFYRRKWGQPNQVLWIAHWGKSKLSMTKRLNAYVLFPRFFTFSKSIWAHWNLFTERAQNLWHTTSLSQLPQSFY